MWETVLKGAEIFFHLMAWFYIAGAIFIVGPAISVSELNCFIKNEEDEGKKRAHKVSRNCYYVWMSIYPIGFIVLILYHAGVLS